MVIKPSHQQEVAGGVGGERCNQVVFLKKKKKADWNFVVNLLKMTHQVHSLPASCWETFK